MSDFRSFWFIITFLFRKWNGKSSCHIRLTTHRAEVSFTILFHMFMAHRKGFVTIVTEINHNICCDTSSTIVFADTHIFTCQSSEIWSQFLILLHQWNCHRTKTIQIPFNKFNILESTFQHFWDWMIDGCDAFVNLVWDGLKSNILSFTSSKASSWLSSLFIKSLLSILIL